MNVILSHIAAVSLSVGLTVFGFMGWPGWLDDAREAGQMAERAAWQEAQRKFDLKMEQDRQKAQAEIDAAETRLLNGQMEAAVKLSALEQALVQERKANAEGSEGGSAAACAPMPDSVRNALNALRD